MSLAKAIGPGLTSGAMEIQKMQIKDLDPERLIRLILEGIEINAACPDCGKLSLESLVDAEACPHCEGVGGV